MDIMAVASASIEKSLAQTQESVNIALLKDVMNTQETQAAQLIESIPSFGHQLDVKI